MDKIAFSALILLALQISVVISQTEPEIPDEDLIVDIPGYGVMRGGQWFSESEERRYVQFLGIPYAEAPLEEKRFKPSKLLTNLSDSNMTPDDDGVFSMKFPGSNCVQTGGYGPGDEDCLFLNLFTHKVKKSEDQKLLPVIIFIHGGAFLFGAGVAYSGIKLLDYDVVFVSMNYRMGAFGFYTLDTPEAPGNAGMYDILNSLKWVQKYIEYFGGDPNDVTLAGQSAGAASAIHMMLSPIAQGLFTKVIASSGSAINAWAYEENALPASLQLADLVNCTRPTLSETGKCMEEVDARVLDTCTRSWIIGERLEGRLGFELTSPVVQKPANVIGTEPFLSENPSRIISRGDYHAKGIPLYLGANRHDGSFILSVFYTSYIAPHELQEDTAFLKERLIPMFLEAMGVSPSSGLIDSLAEYYLGDKKNSGNFTQMIPGLIDLGSVFFFKGAALDTAILHSRTGGDVYFYSFDFKGSKTIYDISGGVEEIPGGVAHADDLMYLFMLAFGLNDRDNQMTRVMTKNWANFAIYNNPNGPETALQEWPKFTESGKDYLKIDESLSIHQDYSKAWQGAADELMEEEVESTTQITETETTQNDNEITTESTTESPKEITTESTTVNTSEITTEFTTESTSENTSEVITESSTEIITESTSEIITKSTTESTTEIATESTEVSMESTTENNAQKLAHYNIFVVLSLIISLNLISF